MNEHDAVADLAWLTSLHKQLWKPLSLDRLTRRRSYTEARTLTTDELDRLLNAIEDHDLLVVMDNACMGFGVGISLYQMGMYPGVDPTFLCQITNKHLSEQARFEDGWQLFSPITFSERNVRLWHFQYGKEPERDRSHYDY